MAVGTNLVEKSLEVLEKEISCAICQDHYIEPKVIPCLHYYCKQCILKLALRTGTDKPFSCPECHKQTTLPKGGVDQLTAAIFINPLKASFATLKQAYGKVEVKCEEIKCEACTDSGAKAKAFCQQCSTFICEGCVKYHQRLKIFSGHNVVSLEELKQEVIRDEVIWEAPSKAVRQHDDNEVIIVHPDRGQKIEHGKRGRTTEPVEVRCANDLQQLCQTEAESDQFCSNPAKRSLVEGAKIAEESEISTTDIGLSNNKHELTKRIYRVGCSMNALPNVSRYIDQAGTIGLFNCTPTVHGQCEQTISMVQIQKEPSTQYTRMPIGVWNGISKPTGITVNSAGEVIVTEWCGDIILFDKKEGKRLRSVTHLEHKLSYLYGVAVDSEDNIYCTDFSTNKIFKCDKNCGNIQVFEVKQIRGPGHRGMAVVGDEVMVCETGNKGTIMVYDRELKYVRQIALRGRGYFYDLSADSQGNLYVTDFNCSCIQVFTNEGDLFRSFCGDEVEAVKLSRPYCVCIAGQRAYVTDSDKDSILGFTTGGKYLTSFGQHGSKEGEINYPRGVCVDKDGFIYVADWSNNRVQVF